MLWSSLKLTVISGDADYLKVSHVACKLYDGRPRVDDSMPVSWPKWSKSVLPAIRLEDREIVWS